MLYSHKPRRQTVNPWSLGLCLDSYLNMREMCICTWSLALWGKILREFFLSQKPSAAVAADQVLVLIFLTCLALERKEHRSEESSSKAGTVHNEPKMEYMYI